MYSFCCLDSFLANLEESVTRGLAWAENMTSPSEDSTEMEMDLSKRTFMREAAMKRALLASFDELCCWQEQVVLGTLMSGLASQIACRLVLRL